MKRSAISAESNACCKYFRCGAWPAVQRFTGRTFGPTQQAFLEAHEEAFAFFGGVFRQLRFDNLASAVKKILRGYRREETTRFIAFRSHWGFASEFCNPAAGHEKGGVEGEAGYFRRNHWVPVPEAADLQELNERLLLFCQEDEARRIAGHELTVGARECCRNGNICCRWRRNGLTWPRSASRPWTVRVASGCGRMRTRLRCKPGQTVQAKMYSNIVELWHENRCVGRHERSYGKLQQVLDLEHYLDVLEHKPGAMAGSKPLGTMPQGGPVAGQLRPLLGRIDPALWKATGDARDDRGHQTRSACMVR